MIQRTLPAAGVAAVLLLLSAACLPVGEIQEENRVVERDGALSAKIDLFMNVGELRLQGGAEDLLDADFIYNVERWKPQIDYRVTGDRGRLTVRQGESPAFRWETGGTVGKSISRRIFRWISGLISEPERAGSIRKAWICGRCGWIWEWEI